MQCTKFYFQLNKLARQCSNVNINQKNSIWFLYVRNDHDFLHFHELHYSKHTISSRCTQKKIRLSAPTGNFSILETHSTIFKKWFKVEKIIKFLQGIRRLADIKSESDEWTEKKDT